MTNTTQQKERIMHSYSITYKPLNRPGTETITRQAWTVQDCKDWCGGWDVEFVSCRRID